MKNNTYERISDDRIKLTISISPEKMQEFKDKALRKLGEGMKLEGFRPGKAPLSVIESSVEKVNLMMEMVDIAVKESYYDEVVGYKDEFITIDTPKIEFKSKIEESDLLESGLEYTAEVSVYPEFELPDWKKIKLDRPEPEITDAEYNQALGSFLQRRSKLGVVAEDHQIKTGDWVDIAFEIRVGEMHLTDAGSKNFPLIVGNNSMIPGFEDNLLDLKKGDEKEFTLAVDSSYREKRMAGKDVTFSIKVNEIKSVEIPVLDDELVKTLKIPDVDNMAKFENYLKENLLHEKKHEETEKLRNQVLEKIAEAVNFSIPDALIDREIHLMWHEFEDNLKNRGIEPADYMAKEKLNKDSIKEGWRDQAKKRVKFGLIINQVIKKEKLAVSDQEVDDYLNKELTAIKNQLSASGQPDWEKTYVEYETYYQQPEVKNQAAQRILMDRVFDLLVKETN